MSDALILACALIVILALAYDSRHYHDIWRD